MVEVYVIFHPIHSKAALNTLGYVTLSERMDHLNEVNKKKKKKERNLNLQLCLNCFILYANVKNLHCKTDKLLRLASQASFLKCQLFSFLTMLRNGLELGKIYAKSTELFTCNFYLCNAL